MRHVALALFAAMLMALTASPAPAASRHHARYHYYGHHGHYYGPYAYGGYRPFNSGGPGSYGPIYRQGHYLGTDPDPNVRAEIARDPYFERK